MTENSVLTFFHAAVPLTSWRRKWGGRSRPGSQDRNVAGSRRFGVCADESSKGVGWERGGWGAFRANDRYLVARSSVHDPVSVFYNCTDAV